MDEDRARERARAAAMQSFRLHISAYFAATILLFIVNFQVMPENLVVIWPLLAWGAVVALHAAKVMDLLPWGRSR